MWAPKYRGNSLLPSSISPPASSAENVPLEKTPRGLEFDPNGRRLYITQAGLDSLVVVDPANNIAVAEIPVGVSPHYANFTPDGKRGLTAVQGPSLLAVFNPQTNVPKNRSKSARGPIGLPSGPDGKTALTTNEGSNDVSIVDLENGTVTNIPVGNAPRKIAVQTAADRATIFDSPRDDQRICLYAIASSN